MDDALLVRGFERFGNLTRDPRSFNHRNRTVAQPIGQRRALDELENQELGVAALLDAVDARDVRMVERREQFRFPLEPRDSVRIVRDRLRQRLDRHVPPELGVAGAIDLAHTSGTQRRRDDVRPDSMSRAETHASGVIVCATRPASF